MALAYNEHRVTSDLDAVFEPKNRVYELAQRVAAESELKIDENWLNDGVKGFLIGEDPAPRGVLTDVPGLSVRVASPRYPFALKAMAARESDLDDLHILYPLCGFSSVEDALSTVEDAYPTLTPKPVVEFLIREIASAHEETQRGDSPNGSPAGS